MPAPVQRLMPDAIEAGILHGGSCALDPGRIEEDSVGDHASIAEVDELVVCLQIKMSKSQHMEVVCLAWRRKWPSESSCNLAFCGIFTGLSM
jgi:hypothetical protein